MALEKFYYTHGKGKITLPKFDQLPFGLIRKLRKEEDGEVLFALFERVLENDEKSLEILDTLPMGEVQKLFSEWQKDSEANAGESLA